MGEQSVLEERIVGNRGALPFLHRDGYRSFAEKAGCLHIFYADNLKYIHLDALCCNKCKPNLALKETLMLKTSRGQRNA